MYSSYYFTLPLCLFIIPVIHLFSFFFFFNDTATTEIYTLPYTTLFRSLLRIRALVPAPPRGARVLRFEQLHDVVKRSEEHTSELQSQSNLVCRLLLEKKKKISKDTQLKH